LRYNLEIVTDDTVQAKEILETVAQFVGQGATELMGSIGNGEAIWNMISSANVYDDGDYTDDEGNLLHVHDDAVVHVTWAKTAKQEDFADGIDIDEWHEKHGHLRPAA